MVVSLINLFFTPIVISFMDSNYVVTARKWRPLRFDAIVGQDHISTTLKNAIELKRVHHAYIFTGPRGVGKTTSARVLAKALNCMNLQSDLEPCGECVSCTSITQGNSIDVIEIDGASNNGVDDVRKLRENSKYPPVNGKYKVYIIDEVHMLSTSAFNALLKTLEEPPPHLLFIFATTEIHKVPATIVSRCQRFDFRRMDIKNIVSQLQYIAQQEHITIDEPTLLLIAKQADGSMRDSQSIFDKVIAFCGKDITIAAARNALSVIDDDLFFDITTAIFHRDAKKMFEIVSVVTSGGFSVHECFNGLIEHFRNILLVQSTGKTDLLEVAEQYKVRYSEEATKFSNADILRFIGVVQSAEQQLKTSTQHTIRLELALVEMSQMGRVYEITELISLVKNQLNGIDVHNEAPTTLKESSPVYSALTDQKEIHSSLETNSTSEKKEITIVPEITEEPLQKNEVPSKEVQALTHAQINTAWDQMMKANQQIFLIIQTLLLNKVPNFDINDSVVTCLCENETIFIEMTNVKKEIQQILRTITGNQTLEFECTNIEKNMNIASTSVEMEPIEPQTSSLEILEKLSDSKKAILSEIEGTLSKLFGARIIL